MTDRRLAGCNVLVLGGGSGIGRGAAIGYHSAGAHVTVVERSAENAERLSAAADVEVIVGDATSSSVVRDAIRSVVDSRGSITNLTCCVGVFDHYASLRTLSDEEFDQAAEEMWLGDVIAVRELTVSSEDSRLTIDLKYLVRDSGQEASASFSRSV